MTDTWQISEEPPDEQAQDHVSHDHEEEPTDEDFDAALAGVNLSEEGT